MVETEGFIISEVSYGETSKIINIFTKDYGIIGVHARGAKTIKSPFRSTTSAFLFVKINIRYKVDKLSILISSDIINPFKFIRSDLQLLSFLTYLIDLSSQVYRESLNENIYDLLKLSLLKIEDGMDPFVMTNLLEIKYLDFLGVAMNLECCSKCGSLDIVTFDVVEHSLCDNCVTNQIIFGEKIIKLMKLYKLVNLEKISKTDVEKDITKTISLILSAYYDNYTGLYLKSKKFLDVIIDI